MSITPQFIKNGTGLHFDYSQDHVFVKLSSMETDGELCVVEDRLKPGFFLPRHVHKIMTETFYIIEGEFELILDNETITGSKGDTITIAPGTWHAARSLGGATLITIFKNGSFDAYLVALSNLEENEFKNEELMTSLANKFDIYYL